MRMAEKLRQKLAAGELALGANSLFSDPAVSELLALAGNDFVWIDMEHAALDNKDVALHLMAAQSGGAAALIRLPWNDQVLVKRVADMGPDGIIFPLVKTAADVEQAIAACRYPPHGIRGWNPIRAVHYGLADQDAYLAEADTQFLKIMMIEHIDAVHNIDAILRVPGLDAVILGPSDLSASMGKLTRIYDADVQEALGVAAKAAAACAIPLGVALGSGTSCESIAIWLKMGVKLLSYGQDVNLLADAVRQNRDNVLKAKAACGRMTT